MKKQMNNKKKLLIVGGTGFIGFWLAKACLKKNYKVTSLSTKYPRKDRYLKGVKYITCDIEKKNDLVKKFPSNIDYIVNLGGYVNHNDKEKTFKSHFNGCKNLVQISKKKKVKLFIQMGSSGEYFGSRSPHYEKMINKRPHFGYNSAKYASSKYLLKEYKKSNFPVIILRLYQAYGPEQDINRLIPIAINACLDGRIFPCSSGSQYRDFIYIEDVINLIEKCLKSNFFGEIFNIGTGKPIKIKNVINIIRNKLKNGIPDYGKIKLRKDETKYIFPNIEKSKKYFKWKPKIDFKIGLNKTINYYKMKKKKSFNITAVIPVRKNSQRVKNKNFRKFHRENLLIYKIKQLKRIKGINKIIVNTDSTKAIKIAKKLKVNFWKRENYYASSKCKNSDFWKHVGQTTEGDLILFINCTSPLISDKTIKDVINIYKLNHKKFDSINTASIIKDFLYKNNKPFNFNPSKAPNSQNLPNLHKLNFGVNLLPRSLMIKNKSIIGKKPYLFPVDDIEGIDIDTKEDFDYAESVFKNLRKK